MRPFSKMYLAVLVVGLVSLLASAAVGAPLTWNDLVNHPERWPKAVRVLQDVEFQSGKKVQRSVDLAVLEVEAGSATLMSPDGLVFGAGPKDCNLVAAANTFWNSLSPEQRALTLASIAGDETLVPEKVTVTTTLDFGDAKIEAGTEVLASAVTAQGVDIGFKDIMTTLKPEQTNVYARARALVALPKAQRPVQKYIDSLTPQQRALTVQGITADKSIIPMKVTLRLPVINGRAKALAGSEVELASITNNGDVGVVVQGETILVPAKGTDVLRRARDLMGLPLAQRPDRMQGFFADRSVSSAGRPMPVKPADHYLLYFASSTCPRCEVYSPKFVKRVHDTLVGKNVSVVSVANQNTPEALAYAAKTGVDWPIVAWEKRRPQLNDYHATLQPGMTLVDKFGNILATNMPGYADLATVDAVVNALDAILAASPAAGSMGSNPPATGSAPTTGQPQPPAPPAAPAGASNAPPLLYAVTFTPGTAWKQGTHYLQQPGIKDHGTYWNDRTSTGELVTMGLIDDGMGGAVALVQGASLDAVKTLVAADPAVKSGLLKAEVRSWRAVAWMGEVNIPAAAAKYRQVGGK